MEANDEEDAQAQEQQGRDRRWIRAINVTDLVLRALHLLVTVLDWTS